jgi:hypothetical protein
LIIPTTCCCILYIYVLLCVYMNCNIFLILADYSPFLLLHHVIILYDPYPVVRDHSDHTWQYRTCAKVCRASMMPWTRVVRAAWRRIRDQSGITSKLRDETSPLIWLVACTCMLYHAMYIYICYIHMCVSVHVYRYVCMLSMYCSTRSARIDRAMI